MPFSFGDEPANAGEMTVIQCAVVKGDSPITISWFLNGVEITPGYQGMLIGKMSHRISTLSIEAVKARHSGEYTCRASNAAGKTDHSAHLYVNGNIIQMHQFLLRTYFLFNIIVAILEHIFLKLHLFPNNETYLSPYSNQT